MLPHAGVVPVHTVTFSMHTQAGRGSSPVLLTRICPRKVLTGPQGASPEKPLDLTHFQFENKSRTTCPESSNHSLCLIKLSTSSYLEGDVGPDGSISLSPSPHHLPPPLLPLPPPQPQPRATQQHTQRHRDTETERQRDRETAEGISRRMVRFVFRHQDPIITNDVQDLPQWFHVFCYISDQ